MARTCARHGYRTVIERSVAADCGVDVLRRNPAVALFYDRHADVALPYGAASQFEHPLQRHAGAVHDLWRKLDARLQVAEANVELLERVERHVGAHVAIAVPVAAGDPDEGLVRRRFLHLVDD